MEIEYVILPYQDRMLPHIQKENTDSGSTADDTSITFIAIFVERKSFINANTDKRAVENIRKDI